GGEGVKPLNARFVPADGPTARTLAKLIANLDDDRFDVREAATQELRRLGSAAEPALRKALEGKPSAEARRRIGGLLEIRGEEKIPAEQLRALRAIAVLERIGSPAAKEVLEALAKGAPGAKLTQEAKASLERLARR